MYTYIIQMHRKCMICRLKRPIFGYSYDKRANYCGQCKHPGMIDIVHPKCIICKLKIPAFGYPNDKRPQYCGDCKLDDMDDIKSTKCMVCKQKRPTFAYPNEKAQYCGDCKLEGMYDVVHHKCIVCKIKIPAFGYSTYKRAQYCGDCKLQGMDDIKSPKCKNEWCNTRTSNKAYEGYCAYCFMHMFPDKPMARNIKNKECSVVEYIKEQFNHIDIVTDKTIQGGCSKRRPDILIDLGYQVIIIEIDENQHIDYGCSCENKRMMELSQDVGHRPIVFIRFNPDDYKISGKTITSCWGISSIKKSKKKEWNQRLQMLKNTVDYWLQSTNVTDKLIEVIYLYYDQ